MPRADVEAVACSPAVYLVEILSDGGHAEGLVGDERSTLWSVREAKPVPSEVEGSIFSWQALGVVDRRNFDDFPASLEDSFVHSFWKSGDTGDADLSSSWVLDGGWVGMDARRR